jgi:glycosyltransferase involved in cell wall biosynthesis
MRSILYVAPCSPGKAYGTELRAAQIIRALETIGKVDLVVVKLDFKPVPEPRTYRVIEVQQRQTHTLWETFRSGFDAKFMAVNGQIAAKDETTALLKVLPQYELVWIHSLRTANALGQWRWARSVMDIDDIPSTFLRTLHQNSRSFSERVRADLRRRAAKRRERYLSERFTILSVCSEADREYLDIDGKVHVIPNGFEPSGNEPLRCPAYPPRIGFIGTFEYSPNAAGVCWFVEQCWPRIKQHIPNARLRLVGSGSKGPLTPSGCDIDALGYMEDTAAEIATWSATIVPLHLGAGTRVKIAEAFSRKCPVVSTSLGAYGYDVADGRELLLADTAEAFASACVRVIHQPSEAAAMAETAWHQFLEKWTWDAIQPRVWAAAEECLRNGS